MDCDCKHHVVQFTKLRDELKPLNYYDSTGNPIDPEWLTITHNKAGGCHGKLEGYSLEYRREDGSVITWEEFRTKNDIILAMESWHGVAVDEWQTCLMKDTDFARPWAV